LEKTASVLSLAVCMYDNYPELDIDLILAGLIINLFCGTMPRRECYDRIKDDRIIPLVFRKKRKKPSVEITVFDALQKLDNKVFIGLKKRRKKQADG